MMHYDIYVVGHLQMLVIDYFISPKELKIGYESSPFFTNYVLKVHSMEMKSVENKNMNAKFSRLIVEKNHLQ